MKKILLILSLALTLTSCGSSGVSTSDYSTRESINSYDSTDYNSSVDTESGTEDSNRKIEKSYSINIETKEYKEDFQKLENLIKKYNGLVESSNEYVDSYDNNKKNFKATVRVATEKGDDFYKEIKTIGKTTNASVNTDDITKSYDINDRKIESLKAELDSLNKMYETVQDYNDLITINSRINEVQSQLSYLEENKIDMDDRVQKDTFEINMTEVLDYRNVEEGTKFSTQVKQAFTDSIFMGKVIGRSILLLVIRLWIFILLFIAFIILIKKYNKNKPKKAKTLDEKIKEEKIKQEEKLKQDKNNKKENIGKEKPEENKIKI